MLNIDEPVSATRRWALWDLAFRPFFLFAALYSCLALTLWITHWYQAALPIPQLYSQGFYRTVAPLWWHPHEMLFGYAMAIVVGFLLTAAKTWTQQPTYRHSALIVVFLLWASVRVLLLSPINLPLWLPALLESAFLLACGVRLWLMVWRVRQYRNMVFPLLLFGALLINLLSYYALLEQNFSLANHVWQTMIWWMVLMITLIGGRVIPFFTAVRLKLTKPEPIPALEWSVWLFTGAIALFAALPWFGEIEVIYRQMPAFMLLTAAIHLYRMSRWNGWKAYREPLLWSLHLSYLVIPFALIAMAYWHGDPYAQRQLLHLLAVGSIGGMTLAMIARVSLGHTGRDLYAGPSMALPFALVLLAALSRGVLPLLWPERTFVWHWLAVIGWVLAFGYFVLRYTQILLRPRPDGRPG
ncbi:NnrS family protein [Ferrimonas pelagia]|uniref:NnrS family protein n=1 Tax=Ferrimonas pelagia TaxID=1177826 RepID=A0ABP9FH59_9GAMM